MNRRSFFIIFAFFVVCYVFARLRLHKPGNNIFCLLRLQEQGSIFRVCSWGSRIPYKAQRRVGYRKSRSTRIAEGYLIAISVVELFHYIADKRPQYWHLFHRQEPF